MKPTENLDFFIKDAFCKQNMFDSKHSDRNFLYTGLHPAPTLQNNHHYYYHSLVDAYSRYPYVVAYLSTDIHSFGNFMIIQKQFKNRFRKLAEYFYTKFEEDNIKLDIIYA